MKKFMLKTSSKPILSIKILVFRINPSKELLCLVDWFAREGGGVGAVAVGRSSCRTSRGQHSQVDEVGI